MTNLSWYGLRDLSVDSLRGLDSFLRGVFGDLNRDGGLRDQVLRRGLRLGDRLCECQGRFWVLVAFVERYVSPVKGRNSNYYLIS